mgnify:CR=1 FL=1
MQEKNISPSGKLQWKPGTLIYPLPALMVSCGENEEEYNIFDGYKTLPLDIEFSVAPAVSISDATSANMKAIIQSSQEVEYPYLGNKKITAPDGYVFYGENSFVSHVHTGWNEWNDNNWDDFIAMDYDGRIEYLQSIADMY